MSLLTLLATCSRTHREAVDRFRVHSNRSTGRAAGHGSRCDAALSPDFCRGHSVPLRRRHATQHSCCEQASAGSGISLPCRLSRRCRHSSTTCSSSTYVRCLLRGQWPCPKQTPCSAREQRPRRKSLQSPWSCPLEFQRCGWSFGSWQASSCRGPSSMGGRVSASAVHEVVWHAMPWYVQAALQARLAGPAPATPALTGPQRASLLLARWAWCSR